MSRPISNNRNLLPLAPIPESSQVHFTPSPPAPAPTLPASEPFANAMVHSMPYISGMPEQYWNTPDHAACVFSTQNGRYPKRQLPKNEPWPMPIIRTDLHHDVQKTAQLLVRQFPELARGITPTDQWYHLYKYWDAVDIWTEGAGFCYFVLHRIGMVNKELDVEQNAMIDEFAKEWVADHEHLVVDNPHVKDLLELFDCGRHNFAQMRLCELQFLRRRLDYHRHNLLSRVQEHRRTMMQRAPAGMIGPYPMYPPLPNFPHGLPMIDPQRTSTLMVQGISPSPKPPMVQNYNQFVESQRNLQARFGPRVPPINLRNENRLMDGRTRGWSNDTARNGRKTSGWSNRNGRSYVPATPQPSPPRPMQLTGSGEPIYVLASQNPSPQSQRTSAAQRVFSDPIGSQDPHSQVGQRAFSDSPAGRGTFNDEPIAAATSLGRRASTNDVESRLKCVLEKMAPPRESQAAARSDTSTPHAPISNDARVLEAMEDGRGMLFKGLPEQHPVSVNALPDQCPGVSFNAHPAQSAYSDIEMQRSFGKAGPIHMYFYAGVPRRFDYAEQNHRSIFISASPYKLFENHELKEFCTQCGEVDNISFLPEKNHAFVAFMDPGAAELAVRQLHGAEFGGYKLMVNRPKPRARGDSYSSQRSNASNRTVIGPRDAEQYSPFSRRPSFREPYHHTRNLSRTSVDGPHHVRNFSRQSNENALVSPPRFTGDGGLMSSVAEVLQHNAALNRMGPPMPLESIENHYGRSPQTKPNHEYRNNGDIVSQNSQYNKKENSPMKSDRPPKTPSRKGSFSSQAGGQGSKRKNNTNNKRPQVSRQNSSTSAQVRPTPGATPTKSRPGGILTAPINDSISAVDSKKDDEADSIVSAQMNAQPEANEDVAAEKPKQKRKNANQKKKRNALKNEEENATSAGLSGNSNTSFATESSDAFDVTSPVGTESSMGFTSNNTNTSFSDLPSRKQSVVSSVSSPPLSETPEENYNIFVKALSPKMAEIDEKSVTPKPSQSRLSSETPDDVVKQRLASGKAHSGESVVSTASTMSLSMRKSDAKMARSDGEAESPEAKINFDDQKEFPALGPASSPLSSIADGKRPAAHAAPQRPPTIGSLTERVASGSGKNQIKPVVPVVAVPRSYMQRQAPQP